MIESGLMKNYQMKNNMDKKTFKITIESLDPTGVVVSSRKMSFETHLPKEHKNQKYPDEPMRMFRYFLELECDGLKRIFRISPHTLELEEHK